MINGRPAAGVDFERGGEADTVEKLREPRLVSGDVSVSINNRASGIPMELTSIRVFMSDYYIRARTCPQGERERENVRRESAASRLEIYQDFSLLPVYLNLNRQHRDTRSDVV